MKIKTWKAWHDPIVPRFADDATQLAFAHGVFRTQAALMREGFLK